MNTTKNVPAIGDSVKFQWHWFNGYSRVSDEHAGVFTSVDRCAPAPYSNEPGTLCGMVQLPSGGGCDVYQHPDGTWHHGA